MQSIAGVAMLESDKAFAGSIPESYDRHMVPLIFAQYAADLAQRAAALSPDVLPLDVDIPSGPPVAT